MRTLEKDAFDLIHNLVYEHLIETDGNCDHDKHSEIMQDVIDGLSKEIN